MTPEAPRGINSPEFCGPEKWIDVIRETSPFAKLAVEIFLEQVSDPDSVEVDEVLIKKTENHVHLSGAVEDPQLVGRKLELRLERRRQISLGISGGSHKFQVIIGLYDGDVDLLGPDLEGNGVDGYHVNDEFAYFLKLAEQVVSRSRDLQEKMRVELIEQHVGSDVSSSQ